MLNLVFILFLFYPSSTGSFYSTKYKIKPDDAENLVQFGKHLEPINELEGKRKYFKLNL